MLHGNEDMWDDSDKKKAMIQYIETSYDNVLFNETPTPLHHTHGGTHQAGLEKAAMAPMHCSTDASEGS